MKREFEFRVWDNDDKKYMTLDDYEKMGCVMLNNDGTLYLTSDYRFVLNMMIKLDKYVVEQYTGLKDKNGVKIFEGDIIDIHQTVNGYNQFIIIYNNYKFTAEYFNEKTKRRTHRLYEYDLDELFEVNEYEKEIEVIGNIHENNKGSDKE